MTPLKQSKRNIIGFGKYKGRTPEWVVDNDPSYADWIMKQSNSQNKAKRNIQSVIDKRK